MIMIRKLTAAAGLAVAMSVGAGGLATAAEPVVETTVEVRDVDWTILSENCSQVPAGTVVDGEGTMRTVVTTRVKNGVTALYVHAVARGSATDQDGNTYRFVYDNTWRAKNTVAEPDVFRGTVLDSFALRGAGPAAMRNGFLAESWDDFATGAFALTPVRTYGDPFSFPSGPGRCDPI